MRILRCIFGGYILLVLVITLFTRERTTDASIHLIPYWNLSFIKAGIRGAVVDVIMNIVMFVPFGYLLRACFPKITFVLALIVCTCFSIVVEASQYLFHLGICETYDVIHNSLGGMVGICLYATYRHVNQRFDIL